jgi:hypothetical protein
MLDFCCVVYDVAARKPEVLKMLSTTVVESLLRTATLLHDKDFAARIGTHEDAPLRVKR